MRVIKLLANYIVLVDDQSINEKRRGKRKAERRKEASWNDADIKS